VLALYWDWSLKMKKNLFKDIIIYLPAQVLPGLIAFFSIPIATRLFSPADYGAYMLVLSTVMILMAFSGWLPMAIIRFFPMHERRNESAFFIGNINRLVFITIVSITFLYLLALYCVKGFLPDRTVWLFLIGVFAFIADSLFAAYQFMLRARRSVAYFTTFSIIQNLFSFSIALFLIFYLKQGVESFLLGRVICVVLIGYWVIGKATACEEKTAVPIVHKPLFLDMARYSLPLVAGNLAALVLSSSDRYVLQIFRGASEVGIYSASYNLSDRSVMMLVNLIGFASGPIAMSIWEKEGETKSKEFMAYITRIYLIVCLPVVVFISVLSQQITGLLMGKAFVEGYRIIPIIMAGSFFFAMQWNYQMGLLYNKKTHYITIGIVFCGILNLALNLLLVPRFGYISSASATLAYIVMLIMMVIFSRKFFKWDFPFRSLGRILSAVMISGAVVYILGTYSCFAGLAGIAFRIIGGLVVYAAALQFLGEIDIGKSLTRVYSLGILRFRQAN
jgi:O-antigen/teichoic acid export membrane protein